MLADAFYGHPSRDLRVVGITGTNGKTTTAYLLRSILEAAGEKCGLLGTVVYIVGGEDRAATRTTPEAPDVKRMLREMADNGCRAAVMEVSSHALALQARGRRPLRRGRLHAISRADHLDFHGDMEAYFAAKRAAVRDAARRRAGRGQRRRPQGAGARRSGRAAGDLRDAQRRPTSRRSHSTRARRAGVRRRARRAGRVACARTLVGRPNVYNLLAAVAAGVALGVPLEAIEAGIAALAGVPGGFEVVSAPSDDIARRRRLRAHRRRAEEPARDGARPLAPGRLITVFGCGGDRDRDEAPADGRGRRPAERRRRS